MRQLLIISIIICIIAAYSQALAGSQFRARVMKIIDGDSLVVNSSYRSIEIRLYGIDCPEFDQHYSAEARRWLKKRIQGKFVTVTPLYPDAYNRLVAIVRFRGQRINGELVEHGLAWVYPRYCRKKVCAVWRKFERSAREKRRGIWAGEKEIAPWKWKQMKRQK